MSESDSDSDSGDSDKEIIVRHIVAREQSSLISRVAEPKSKSPPQSVNPDHQTFATKQNQPSINQDSSKATKKDDVGMNAPSLTRTTSVDSNSSEVSVREEDIHILMRSIPEYKQYNDENGKSNDSYLRSALRSMPEHLLDCKDEYGNTLLLIACQYTCVDLVKLLLRRGANANIINTSGACCLHFACYKDSLSMPIVELLLQHNVSVNVAETLYGCTPLHYAASTGEEVLCRLLIQHGAYIHAHDFDSCSSVDYAIDAGMMALADYLKTELHTIQNTTHNTIHNNPHTSVDNNTIHSPMSPKWSQNNPLHTKERYIDATPPKHTIETPVKARIIINTNSSSLDEFDHTDNTNIFAFSPNTNTNSTANTTNNTNNINNTTNTSDNRAVDGPGSNSYRKPPLPAQYNISSSSSSTKGSPTTSNSNTTPNTKHTSSPPPTVYSNKSSPDSNASITNSYTHTNTINTGNPNNTSNTTGSTNNTNTTTTSNTNKRGVHQPISPSPYKPIHSPSNNYNNISSSSSSNSSGSDKVVHTRASPSVGSKGFFVHEDGIHTTNNTTNTANTTHTTHTNTTHTNTTHNIPPLPTPTHFDDSNYSNIDNITDLSSEKFELYIEQAKFNAKLTKERELHKSILYQRDSKINTMQNEINNMKRVISNYKEEVHALSAKLDILQLPFIEATNTLQDEMLTLRRENGALREQLRNNSSNNGSGGGTPTSGIYSGKT